MSAFRKGRKRHPHSMETRRRISESSKGVKRNITSETRAAFSRRFIDLNKSRTGQPLSAKHRASLSVGWNNSEASKAHLDELHKNQIGKPGHPFTDTMRSALASPERNGKLSQNASKWQKGRTLPIEHRASISKGLRTTKTPPGGWNLLDDEQRAARIQKSVAAYRRNFPSNIERIVSVVLDSLGVSYVNNASVGRYYVDFLIESSSLVIECDGAYWHKDRKEYDAERDAFIVSKGYRVVRLPEAAITSGQSAALLKKAIG